MSANAFILRFAIRGGIMAEGDKFERRLRGFGWRKVYELSKSAARMSMVVDAAVTAASRGLRNELACSRLAEILSILQFSLLTDWQQGQSETGFRNNSSPLSCMSVELQRIEEAELGSITARLASSAAQSVYAEFHRLEQYPTRQRIQDAFAVQLVWKIIDNRCLTHVREGIALGVEYTSLQQEQWEADFRKALRGQAQKLLKSMIRHDGSQAVARAPRRLTPKQRMTNEILHQPLQAIVQ